MPLSSDSFEEGVMSSGCPSTTFVRSSVRLLCQISARFVGELGAFDLQETQLTRH